MHPERWLDVLRLRLRSLVRRRAVERELEGELQFHLELEIEENVRRGMSRSEAKSAALRRLGGVAQIQEECRDERRTAYWDDLIRDLHYAGRMLRKTPAFTLAAVATLALGIGANTAIFQLLDAVRLRRLPVPEPSRLALIRIAGKGDFGVSEYPDNLSYALFQQIREHQRAFSGVFAWDSGYTNVRIGQDSQTRGGTALAASGDFYPTLGISAAAGRLFVPGDDVRGCAGPPVVLSYAFWQSEYGGAASAIGSRLMVMGKPLEIIGVTPAGFTGPEVGPPFDLSLPLCSMTALHHGDTSRFERRDYSWLNVMGRLKPGWTVSQASEHLRAISPGLMQATALSGYTHEFEERYLQFHLEALSGATGVSRLRETYDDSLWLLLGLTGLVLTIACANLSNLMLARGAALEREFAVRLALGAGKGRLIRQTLMEGLLLTTAGAASGLVLAAVLSRGIVRFLETEGNRVVLDLALDWRMLAFTAAVACLTCILLSLAPALRASRSEPGAAMKAGARGLTADRARFRFQRLLVVVQVAISLVLVAGAFLFVANFRRLVTMDPGFRARGLLQVEFDLGKESRDEAVVRELLEEVRATPQVESAASTTHYLIRSGMWSLIARTDAMERDARFMWVSPRFFATLRIPILAGRDFTNNDSRTSHKVAVVNDIFAKMFFPGTSAIGKTFRTLTEPGYPETEYEVVGLIKNTRYQSLQEAEPAMVYEPISQFPPGVEGGKMFIRSSAPLAAVEGAVRRRISGWRPGTGMQFQVFEKTIADSMTRERLLAALSGFFGGLAGLLAVIGLYGVLAYHTMRRRNEIGIRMALGASRAQIVGLVVNEAAVLIGVGLAIGIGGSLVLEQTAAGLVFGMSPGDRGHLGGAVAALGAAAAIGTVLPARRASRVDPMNALRDE